MSSIPPNNNSNSNNYIYYGDNINDPQLTPQPSLALSISQLSLQPTMVINEEHVIQDGDGNTLLTEGVLLPNNSNVSSKEAGYRWWPESYHAHLPAGKALNNLSENQIQQLTEKDLNDLSPDSVAVLESKVINNLSPDVIAKLEPHVLNELNPGACGKIRIELLLNLSAATAGQLKPRFINNLSAETTQQITFDFFRNLSPVTRSMLQISFLNNISPDLNSKLDTVPFERFSNEHALLNDMPFNHHLSEAEHDMRPLGLFRSNALQPLKIEVLEKLPDNTLVDLQKKSEVLFLALPDSKRQHIAYLIVKDAVSKWEDGTPLPDNLTSHVIVNMSSQCLNETLQTISKLDENKD